MGTYLKVMTEKNGNYHMVWGVGMCLAGPRVLETYSKKLIVLNRLQSFQWTKGLYVGCKDNHKS